MGGGSPRPVLLAPEPVPVCPPSPVPPFPCPPASTCRRRWNTAPGRAPARGSGRDVGAEPCCPERAGSEHRRTGRPRGPGASDPAREGASDPDRPREGGLGPGHLSGGSSRHLLTPALGSLRGQDEGGSRSQEERREVRVPGAPAAFRLAGSALARGGPRSGGLSAAGTPRCPPLRVHRASVGAGWGAAGVSLRTHSPLRSHLRAPRESPLPSCPPICPPPPARAARGLRCCCRRGRERGREAKHPPDPARPQRGGRVCAIRGSPALRAFPFACSRRAPDAPLRSSLGAAPGLPRALSGGPGLLSSAPTTATSIPARSGRGGAASSQGLFGAGVPPGVWAGAPATPPLSDDPALAPRSPSPPLPRGGGTPPPSSPPPHAGCMEPGSALRGPRPSPVASPLPAAPSAESTGLGVPRPGTLRQMRWKVLEWTMGQLGRTHPSPRSRAACLEKCSLPGSPVTALLCVLGRQPGSAGLRGALASVSTLARPREAGGAAREPLPPSA
ncbi:proline-rich protein 36-like [Choloepus didactylus]|uniref:proline-rich protein 36-like n=1 Tax=Choloepus didactylus TaxID=27675 RepID=UPI0018A064BA|nr:proline-rich protein 36-like [Choloepus didactylus]